LANEISTTIQLYSPIAYRSRQVNDPFRMADLLNKKMWYNIIMGLLFGAVQNFTGNQQHIEQQLDRYLISYVIVAAA